MYVGLIVVINTCIMLTDAGTIVWGVVGVSTYRRTCYGLLTVLSRPGGQIDSSLVARRSSLNAVAREQAHGSIFIFQDDCG